MTEPSSAAMEPWKEPPLTCPHIDALMARQDISPEVAAELAAIRDINSQLRYGTWVLAAERDEAREEVTRYIELLDATIQDYNDVLAGGSSE